MVVSDPTWTGTANPNAVVTRDELLEWLKIKSYELKALCDLQGFPPPRFTGRGADARKVTARSRWRVGDVRAWLAARATLRKELATPTAAAEETPERLRERRAADELWIKTH